MTEHISTSYLELLALLPRCGHRDEWPENPTKFTPIPPLCERLGTKDSKWQDACMVFCDEHAGGRCDANGLAETGEPGPDLPWAHHVRQHGELALRTRPREVR